MAGPGGKPAGVIRRGRCWFGGLSPCYTSHRWLQGAAPLPRPPVSLHLPEPGALPSRWWGISSRNSARVHLSHAKPPQTSPFPAPAGSGGLAASQDFRRRGCHGHGGPEGPGPPEHSPHLLVSLAEGTAGTAGQPRVPAPGNRAGRKGFFPKERVAVRLISVPQDGPSTAWLHPETWGGA